MTMGRSSLFRRLCSFVMCFALASCGARGHNFNPTGVNNNVIANVVSPEANSEQDLTKAVADAQALGLNVKVLRVDAKEKTYQFPLTAHVLRSKKSLVVLAYDGLYVWPLDSVSLKAGSDSLDISSLPFHATPGLDGYVEGMKWIPQRHMVRKHIDNDPDQVCPDCAVLFAKSRPDKPASPLLKVIDIWQQDRSFTPWVDPNIPLQTTNGLNVGSGIHPFFSMAGCYLCSSACPSGWSCYSSFYWWTPYWYYFDGSTPGSSAPAPMLEPGCPTQAQTAAKVYAKLVSQYNYLFGEMNPSSTQYPFGEEAIGGIYINDDDGSYYYSDPTIVALTEHTNPDGSISYTADVTGPPQISGYTAVGWYHTHNFDPNNTSSTETNGSHFSTFDINAFPGLTPYVGVASGMNQSVNWYSYNNSTHQDSAGTAAGQGHC